MPKWPLILALIPLTTMADDNTVLPFQSPVVLMQAPARSVDVKTVDGIIAALYHVISGGIGEARDWARMRSLFVPDARIQAIAPKKDGGFALRVLTVSDYIANSGPLLMESGFREKELARRTENWGELVQVWSAYEGIREKQKDSLRGINSIQLMFDGQRWWIVSLLFEAERADLVLPVDWVTRNKP